MCKRFSATNGSDNSVSCLSNGRHAAESTIGGGATGAVMLALVPAAGEPTSAATASSATATPPPLKSSSRNIAGMVGAAETLKPER